MENNKIDIEELADKKYKIYDYEFAEDYSDRKQVKEICDYIRNKMKFQDLCIFYQNDRMTCNIIDNKENKLFTVYGRSLKEIDIKVATFSFYYRNKK